jgi:hypothetical protein
LDTRALGKIYTKELAVNSGQAYVKLLFGQPYLFTKSFISPSILGEEVRRSGTSLEGKISVLLSKCLIFGEQGRYMRVESPSSS